MDNELVWNRIIGACRVIALQKSVDIPDELTAASGNVWQRNAQRTQALIKFCQQAGIDADFITIKPSTLNGIADMLDGIALGFDEELEELPHPTLSQRERSKHRKRGDESA